LAEILPLNCKNCYVVGISAVHEDDIARSAEITPEAI